MTKHIDYEKTQTDRMWWFNSTGGSATEGLTVRDYFAAKVLEGFLVSTKFKGSIEDYAIDAYAVADAMMKERAK